MAWDQTFSWRLLSAKNPQEFLSAFFQKSQTPGPKITYAAIARRSGLARSFVRELTLGKKKASLTNWEKLANALRLEGMWKELLLTLVRCSETDDTGHVQDLRALLQKSLSVHPVNKSTDTVYYLQQTKHFPQIYAALGPQPQGRSPQDIATMTGLPIQAVSKEMEILLAAGLVEKIAETSRYHTTSLFQKMSTSALSPMVRSHYVRSLERIQRLAHTQFHDQDFLFWEATYSVAESQWPAFRAELSQLLERYALAHEDQKGDTIATLLVALCPGNKGQVPYDRDDIHR